MNLDMTVHIWKEDDQYVAHAMPLDVMSSGTTPEESRQALDEAVRVFLLTAADLGTLEQVLEESGYERHGDRWICPAFVAVERHELALAV
jgi:predicted RNase H-like HicB family nuclease